MDRNFFRAAGVALLLTAVACGGGDEPAETLPAPEAASTSAPAETPPAGPIAGPRPEGEVEVTALRVGTTEAAGTHPAVACGRYFMPAAQQGVVYSFTHQNLSVTVMADDRRVPGVQHEDAVSIFVNGGEEPLALTKGNGRIHFSDDFRTAEIDAMLSTVGGAMTGGPGSIPFKATFRCHGA
jgi:hypothetical protein